MNDTYIIVRSVNSLDELLTIVSELCKSTVEG